MDISIQECLVTSVGALLLLMFISRSIKKPLLWLWYGCVYTTCGVVVLFIVNWFGGYYAYHMPINLGTAAVTGILGVPGFMSLVIMQFVGGHFLV